MIQSRAREHRVRASDRTGLGGAGWLGGWIGKARGFGFAVAGRARKWMRWLDWVEMDPEVGDAVGGD